MEEKEKRKRKRKRRKGRQLDERIVNLPDVKRVAFRRANSVLHSFFLSLDGSGSLFYRPTIFFAALGLPRPCFLKRIVAAVFARVLSSSGVLDSLGVIDSGTGFPRRLAISAQNFTNSGRGFFLRIA
jgi:hypothetical protein